MQVNTNTPTEKFPIAIPMYFSVRQQEALRILSARFQSSRAAVVRMALNEFLLKFKGEDHVQN